MRDIPVFTTQHGVASLALNEIPYTQTAYIHLRSSVDPVVLLKECVDFCKIVGAEKIYATGEGIPESFPLYTEILEMKVFKQSLPDSRGTFAPVQEETLDLWRDYYNKKMREVPNAAWMDREAALEMLRNGGGYFVYDNDIPIGIGRVQDNTLMVVASLKKGAGQDVVVALSKLIMSDTVRLEVASTNAPAMRLYERLGFRVTSRKLSWYKMI